MCLPSNDLQKREVLYQVITDSMSSEDRKASHAGLPLPYNIIAGDINAALFTQDVQRGKPDIKDPKHQKFIRDLHLGTTEPDKHRHRQYTFRHRTVAKIIESMTYSYHNPCAQERYPP